MHTSDMVKTKCTRQPWENKLVGATPTLETLWACS